MWSSLLFLLHVWDYFLRSWLSTDISPTKTLLLRSSLEQRKPETTFISMCCYCLSTTCSPLPSFPKSYTQWRVISILYNRDGNDRKVSHTECVLLVCRTTKPWKWVEIKRFQSLWEDFLFFFIQSENTLTVSRKLENNIQAQTLFLSNILKFIHDFFSDLRGASFSTHSGYSWSYDLHFAPNTHSPALHTALLLYLESKKKKKEDRFWYKNGGVMYRRVSWWDFSSSCRVKWHRRNSQCLQWWSGCSVLVFFLQESQNTQLI